MRIKQQIEADVDARPFRTWNAGDNIKEGSTAVDVSITRKTLYATYFR
jgi:hypothetical protein